ncbi:hypothetical protein [uncultured Chryseobacterium sp.]|uniref:hypothetical protein n=1 Tax=uncultured Chryseobacterium sp. TaxID=259322 RepID=UPI0025F4981D|nr:hypothetical protein [uncultured Chryseobacterium sp.]
MNKNLQRNNSLFNYSFFLKLLYIFFVIYDIDFTFSPSFTTARISIVTIILILILKRKKIEFQRRTVNFLLVLLFLIACSILQAAFSNDFTQTSRLFYFTVISLLGAYFIIPFIRSRNELLWLFLIACSIQGVIVLYGFFVPAFKLTLETYIIYGANFGIDNLYRSVGFSSSSGAALSVIQCIGVISAGLLITTNFRNGFTKIIVIVLGLVCFVSIFVVGRTGLWISFIFISVMFGNNYRFILSFAVLTIFFYYINLNALLESATSGLSDFSVEYFSGWLGESLDVSDNATVNALNEMSIPPLDWDTLIGTGKISDSNGLNSSGNDMGYIQTYYSLGLILTFVFYFSLLLFLKSFVKNSSNIKALYILIAIVFFADLKEPMLFKYALPFFIFSIFLIDKKSNLKAKISYESII